MARGGLGAPAGPRLPPPSAGGGPRPSIPRPAHPAREGGDGEAFLEKLKGSPSGHPASRARHQTPTSRRNQRSPTRVSSPLQLGGGRRERGARARGSRGEAGRPLLPQGPPPAAQAPATPVAQSRTIFRTGGQGREPGLATLALRSPLPAPRHCEFVGAAAPSWRVPAPARLPPAQRSAPAPGRCAPTLWGSRGSLAAEPRLMLRREVAASPAAGGGCTRTRRGGEGARRPGPCTRGPARGGHLEARRRSRGTTGGGSGGDQSSST